MSLRLLVRHLADEGSLPFLISTASYVEGDVIRRIQRLIERRIGRPLRPRAGEEALADDGATLLIDGLSGLAREADAVLLRDLRKLQERFPGLRIMACDRRARLMRRLGMTIYRLAPLDSQKRRELASAVVGAEAAEEVLDEIERRLPDASRSPLLLTMALQVWRSGGTFDSRTTLYSAAIEALRARSDGTMSDLALAAICDVAFALVESRQYEADRFWWILNLRHALDDLAAGGLFTVAGTTAEDVLVSAADLGLLVEDAGETTVSFLHDSFRDYLVATIIIRDSKRIPAELTEAWEPAAILYADTAGVPPELIAAAGSNIALCAKLAAFDRDADGVRVDELLPLLRILIERHLGRSPRVVDLGQAEILACYAESYRYILIKAGDRAADRVIPIDELGSQAEAAAVTLAMPRDRGPLSLAFATWRELLALTTLDERLEPPRPSPESDDELLELIATDFLKRQNLLSELSEQFVPSLAERIVAEIGWQGLKARLGPPHRTGLPPGFIDTSRWLYFDTRVSGIDVSTLDGDEDEDVTLPQHDHLEHYLEDTPKTSAMEALVKQLNVLVPFEDSRE